MTRAFPGKDLDGVVCFSFGCIRVINTPFLSRCISLGAFQRELNEKITYQRHCSLNPGL